MKINTLIITIIVFLFPLVLNAQKTNTENEKIRAEKISFLTNEINLSVKEAQEFWPIYNELESLMEKLVSEELTINKELKEDTNSLTANTIEKKIARKLEIKQEKINLELEYFNRFKSVIPIQKVSILYNSEIEFRKHLIKKYLN